MEINNHVPWSSQPSLKSQAEEWGVNYEQLLAGLGKNQSDEQLAEKLQCSLLAIQSLRDHFEHYGLDSVEGQD